VIVVDSSAILAFLFGEPDADRIEAHLNRSAETHISAFSLFECRAAVWRRRGVAATGDLELLVAGTSLRIAPFDAQQSILAFEAYRRFGKGTGHPAQLNLGDCASYALAKSRGLPLLFKGSDFAQTDIACVM
jgi:ribonuclease VapC